jgi:hypothetical protein
VHCGRCRLPTNVLCGSSNNCQRLVHSFKFPARSSVCVCGAAMGHVTRVAHEPCAVCRRTARVIGYRLLRPYRIGEFGRPRTPSAEFVRGPRKFGGLRMKNVHAHAHARSAQPCTSPSQVVDYLYSFYCRAMLSYLKAACISNYYRMCRFWTLASLEL